MLASKKILLGVCGGIAAYKTAELVRLFKKAGAEVRVVMTDAAQQFVTPLTFQALSGEPVHHQLLDPTAEAGMGHIELARWADRIVIAPATANRMAQLAAGMADDLLNCLCLASPAPLWLVPAMNQQMWRAPATQANLATLKARGVQILGPADGEQACGDVGFGRMLEPEQILAALTPDPLLAGLSLLITAGPTREPLDPVRFISNHSSGKMGYALAAACVEAGAQVTLVSGPVALSAPSGVRLIRVETAQQMLDAVLAHIEAQQIFIGCAAVADYRCEQVAAQKLKKQSAELLLRLVPNPDILARVAALPNPPFTLGFAAETEQLETYARRKLEQKRLDLIAANQVGLAETGFNSDNNALSLFWAQGSKHLPVTDKGSLARQLVRELATHYEAKHRIKTSEPRREH